MSENVSAILQQCPVLMEWPQTSPQRVAWQSQPIPAMYSQKHDTLSGGLLEHSIRGMVQAYFTLLGCTADRRHVTSATTYSMLPTGRTCRLPAVPPDCEPTPPYPVAPHVEKFVFARTTLLQGSCFTLVSLRLLMWSPPLSPPPRVASTPPTGIAGGVNETIRRQIEMTLTARCQTLEMCEH